MDAFLARDRDKDRARDRERETQGREGFLMRDRSKAHDVGALHEIRYDVVVAEPISDANAFMNY